MPIKTHATYKVTDDFVEIQFDFGEPVKMNAATLKTVLDNIYRNRNQYATDQAYQEALNIYENALKLLKGQPHG